MRFIIATLFLASAAMAADMGMNIAGHAYNFGYSTGDAGGHSRVESGAAGNVAGSYSYIDPNGDRRTVSYSAGPEGFKASGDVGVDRRTAAAAAAMASLAPKAPVAAAPGVPSLPVSPVMPGGWYGGYYGQPSVYTNVLPGLSGYQAKW